MPLYHPSFVTAFPIRLSASLTRVSYPQSEKSVYLSSHSKQISRRPRCCATSPTFNLRLPRHSLNPITHLLFDKVPTNYDWTDDDDDDGGGGKGHGGRGGGGGGGDGDPGESWRRFVKSMTLWMSRHPIATKMLTTGILGSASDVAAQKLESRRSGMKDWLDWKRSVATGLLLGLFGGPALHGWYAFLGRVGAGLGRKGIALKVMLDQLFFAWIFNGGFLVGTRLIEGNGLSRVLKGLRSSLWPVMKMNWRFWPIMQVFNFCLVPAGLQVLWSNVVGFVWVIILSTLTHAPKKVPLKAKVA